MFIDGRFGAGLKGLLFGLLRLMTCLVLVVGCLKGVGVRKVGGEVRGEVGQEAGFCVVGWYVRWWRGRVMGSVGLGVIVVVVLWRKWEEGC